MLWSGDDCLPRERTCLARRRTDRYAPRNDGFGAVLGANAVLLRRATLYGLAASGEADVDHVARLLKDGVDRTLERFQAECT
jgi:hypothetical protein